MYSQTIIPSPANYEASDTLAQPPEVNVDASFQGKPGFSFSKSNVDTLFERQLDNHAHQPSKTPINIQGAVYQP
jgi:hypothetical protein